MLSVQAGVEAFETMRAGATPEWDRLTTVVPSSVGEDYWDIAKLARALRDEYGNPMTLRERGAFECELGILLHRNLSPAHGPSPGFWRWAALRLLADVTADRHHSRYGKFPASDNYGLGPATECFPYRAWLRAEIGHDRTASANEAYRLARRGNQDFWRSHLIRVSYSSLKPVAHALIEFQYPDESGRPLLFAGSDPTIGMRVLAKRVHLAHQESRFNGLSTSQCAAIIRELADGLSKSDGTVYRSI